MPGLVDIGPIFEEVEIGSSKIKVVGVSAEGLFMVLRRFPEARKALSGLRLTPEELMQLGPKAVAAIIAAGTGSPDDPDEEAAAANLPVGIQAELLTTILRVSVPKGLAALVSQVERLASLASVADPSFKEPVSASPSPSNDSSQQDTEADDLIRGNTLPENSSDGSGS